jgi:hypothetical protein
MAGISAITIQKLAIFESMKLSAERMNFHKLLRWAAENLRRISCGLLFSQRATAMVACP